MKASPVCLLDMSQEVVRTLLFVVMIAIHTFVSSPLDYSNLLFTCINKASSECLWVAQLLTLSHM